MAAWASKYCIMEMNYLKKKKGGKKKSVIIHQKWTQRLHVFPLVSLKSSVPKQISESCLES